ncbi:AraC family transcriptional regulator [Kineosporia sp. J2-2]|uniref:AraC family transcriptional regulator n=1 Tax=Kineosporia corallincola TaxID=2835133 RepID=A0ABS5TP65_9ACTN|nr:AraC family transcriptional regulator [Kineosporia corallincola]MBT0772892.1 AraC family transcriptional regulator [Kineosporia corallincola]
MADSAGDPVRTSSVVTDRPEVAGQLIGQIFARTRLHLDAADQDFRFRVVRAQAGELACGVQQWGFTGRSVSEPLSSFTTVLVTGGSMCQQRPGLSDVPIGPGGVWRSDTEQATHATWSPHSTFATLHLPLAGIADAAGAPAQVRFLDNVPVDATAGRYWAQLMRTAYREAIASGSSLASPLIRAHLVRTLTTAALTVFPNTVMTGGHPHREGAVGPATLRRAVAHMHAHSDQPLTLTQIAEAAGISARALQSAFTRHHGCTPMGYLRRIRLERAHRELEAADPAHGDTVAGIARRWGFGNPGRFAAAYRQAYDVHPRATLIG